VIGNGSVLICEFIEVVNNFSFGGIDFGFGIGLVHFGDNFYFLLNLRNYLITLRTVALCAYVLDEVVGTLFTII
jgi:hypothetical protein